MRKFMNLGKSMLGGTVAMAMLCSALPLSAMAEEISAEKIDTEASSEIVKNIYEDAVTGGSIEFVTEETSNESITPETSTPKLVSEAVTATEEKKTVKKSRNASMAEENGYKYYISGGNAVIDSYVGEETEIVIPETLGGLSVTEIGYAAFSGNTSITSVKIPETVTRINHDAFNGCTSLSSVEVPESVVSIQDGAFAYCASLSSIAVPESLSRIEDNTFLGCTSLSDVKLNQNIDYIGKNSFSQCSTLTEFEIPESVTAIGNMAFAGSGLANLNVPDTVTSLGYGIFANCKGLVEAKLPEDIKQLKSKDGVGMFTNCTALEQVEFPAELTEIGANTFAGCTLLKSISIPNTVTKLGAGAFSGCTSLEEVEIPESVTRIEDATFYNCSLLPSIALHNDIVYLGNSAFEGCTILKDFVIPEKTTFIGENCFCNCDSLTEMNVPSSVTVLGGGAFAGCDSLEKVVIPDTIKDLNSLRDRGMFTDDVALKDVKLPASLKTIGAFTFRNCVSLEKIDLPETLTWFGEYAFENCSSLRKIDIPDAVTVISYAAFNECRSLTAALLPKSIDEVGNCAFCNCVNLADLGKKAGFFKFAEFSFAGCSSLSDERATVFKKNNPTVSVSSVTNIVGGVANFSIKYDLNDWVSAGFANKDNADVRFELPLPAGLMLIEGSVTTDSDDNKVTFIGNNANLVSLTKTKGTLRFSARIEAYNEEDYIINPRISFYSRDYSWSQGLPTMALTVPKITISAQSTISSLNCDIFGIAEPGRKVKIYADGKLVADTVANEHTGKYVVTAELPKKEDSTEYVIQAVCGIEKTNEITVQYSDTKPSIKKVDLMYCTHAPTDTNDFMETLDITGVFTKGERPVIQFYPLGNMRFKITANNPDKISFIVVKSTKGSETKYLSAKYDEEEGVFVTPKDEYFDETNHNYVPGTLNFIIVEKTRDVIDEEYVNEIKEISSEIDGFTKEYSVVDDSSCICRLIDEDGDLYSECYYNSSKAIDVNGEIISADKIAESPEEYGFRKTTKKIHQNGVLYSMYTKVSKYSKDSDDKSIGAAYDSSVLNKVNAAYEKEGKNKYGMNDYLVFSQLLVAENGDVSATLNIQADAQIFEEEEYILADSSSKTPIESFGKIEEIVHNLPGYKLLANENDENEDEGKEKEKEKEQTVGEYIVEKGKKKIKAKVKKKAQEKVDEVAEKVLENHPNASKVYKNKDKIINTVKTVKKYYDVNKKATEEYNEVTSVDWGSDEWNAYRDKNAQLERVNKVQLTFYGDVAGKVPILGKYYSSTIGAINDMMDDLFDKIRAHYKQIADIEAYLAEEEGYDDEDDDYKEEYPNGGKVNAVVDPSGIVYEGVRSRTVSGAVVTCYVLNEDTGEWEVWNAEEYDQVNPLITDAAGAYAWDVPEGRYYVTCEKEGYDLIKSEEFDVAPPKFDLDFNILNRTAPVVKDFTLGDNTITVEFSKLMDISTVNNDTVAISGFDGEFTIVPQLYSAGDTYTDKFVINGDFSDSLELTLTVNSNALDYAGTAAEEYSANIKNVYAKLVLNTESLDLIAENTFQLTANKDIVSYTSADPKVATVDENGLITAVSEGVTKITAVDSVGKEAVVTVSVEDILVLDDAAINKLCHRAEKDFERKSDLIVATKECEVVDNKCIITLKDIDENVLDVYTIDPKTGMGTNSVGEEVDLPQTGNNSMKNWLYAFGSMFMIGLGAIAVKSSGFIRRKKDEQ